MLSTNFIEKLLGLQDVNVTNVDVNDEEIKVFLKMPIKIHHCPNCKGETKYVHSYRRQVIKDIVHELECFSGFNGTDISI